MGEITRIMECVQHNKFRVNNICFGILDKEFSSITVIIVTLGSLFCQLIGFFVIVVTRMSRDMFEFNFHVRIIAHCTV